MPYIKKEQRFTVNIVTGEPGHLNYAITKLCDNYLRFVGKNYRTINDVVGALECAKQEFYRRVVVPYEQKKIEANGDVYSKENI